MLPWRRSLLQSPRPPKPPIIDNFQRTITSSPPSRYYIGRNNSLRNLLTPSRDHDHSHHSFLPKFSLWSRSKRLGFIAILKTLHREEQLSMQSPHAILEITVHSHHSFFLKFSLWSGSKRIGHISLLECLIRESFPPHKTGSIFDVLWVPLGLDDLLSGLPLME